MVKIIFLDRYLCKYIKANYKHVYADHLFNSEIFVNRNIIERLVMPPLFKSARYFSSKNSREKLKVEISDNARVTSGKYTDMQVAYALIQFWKKEFTEEMLENAYRCAKNGYDVNTSLRRFLSRYNIADEEYSLHRAYKKWQRSKQYRNLKELTNYGKRRAPKC